MNINIPSHRSITVQDFMNYKSAPDDVAKVVLISGWERDKVLQLRPDTIRTTIELYEEQLTAVTDFPRTFRVGKKKFGFVPDLAAMSLGEFIELDSHLPKLQAGDYSSIDQFLAILFRPVKIEFGKWYRLERYQLDEVQYYIEAIRQMPIGNMNAALAFFLSIEGQLLEDFPQFLLTTLRKTQTQIGNQA